MKLTFCCLALVATLPLSATAESHTTNILDAVSINASGPFTLGDTGPFNFLLITNAGALSNTVGTVGNSNAAFGNVAIITGPGSVWASASSLTIGVRGASNEVSVLDGAQLIAGTALGVGSYDTSSGNRLQVSGSNSYLQANGFFLGTYSADNAFIVEQGARASLGLLTVNSESSATGRNRILIRNPDTLVSISGTLSVGRSPANFVSVSDGATLVARSLELGLFSYGSANHLDISGLHTLVVATNSLSIGQLGSNNVATLGDSAELQIQRIDVGYNSSGNELRVNTGGRVVNTRLSNPNASLAIGSTPSGNGNFLSLQGPGTIWSNSGYVVVGSAGSGNALVISDGAEFSDTIGSIGGISAGASPGSLSNRVAITGAGSALMTRFGLTVGGSGSGNSLVVSEGGRLNSASADIGQNCVARDNLAFITGAGTVWSNGQIQVGFCSTNNHLVLSNGAQLFAGLVRSSVQGGASNTITVSGPGSLLRAAGDFILGNSGAANSLLIEDGGRVEGRNDRVGSSGESNAAQVLGSGTSWSNQSLTIGDTAPGNCLTVADRAHIDSGAAMLGAGGNSPGNNATLSDAGTAWNIATTLTLGGLGHSNRLSIGEGASVSARNVYLGAGSLLNPTALFNSDWNHLGLQGTGSVLNAASNLVVGASGRWNRLEVRDGAQLSDRDAVLGFSYGSRSNSVLVTGGGSQWHNAGNLLVGSNGMRSELLVSRGGGVTDHAGYIGFGGEPVGEGSSCVTREGGNKVIVTDPGSLWETAGQLYVGYGSIGNVLVISNGGTVRATNIIIGHSTGIEPGGFCGLITNANRMVVDGGCVIVTNEGESAGIEARSGTLTIKSGFVVADVVRTMGSRTGRVELIGGTLRTKYVSVGLPEDFVIGDGLHRANLQLNGTRPQDLPSGIHVGSGAWVRPHAMLTGNGGMGPFLTNSGTLSPGSPLGGALHGSGGLTLNPESVLHIDIGATNQDYILLQGTMFSGGKLRVALHDGYLPAPSNQFTVITAFGWSGSFANVASGQRLKTADNLGSFVATYGPTGLVLSDYQSTDLDGDGIEDAWATDYFGHTPLTAAEKVADADGDGASNYEEFRAGTDPNDPTSALRLSVAYAGGAATVSFPSVDGKEYRVWSSNDLDMWSEVSDPTFAYPSPGRCEWTDDGKDAGGLGAASRFYRVTVD